MVLENVASGTFQMQIKYWCSAVVVIQQYSSSAGVNLQESYCLMLMIKCDLDKFMVRVICNKVGVRWNCYTCDSEKFKACVICKKVRVQCTATDEIQQFSCFV